MAANTAEYWYHRALSLTENSQSLECFECLERAISFDPTHVQALYAIGHHHFHGQGIRQDLPSAAKWFRKAAELGFSPAQDRLATMYVHGLGVAKNWREAARWYLSAAEKGNPDGQYHLSVLYGNGQAFPVDHAEAAKWCRKAAEQGHRDAQFTLGRIYMVGFDGVPQNPEEASKWLLEAAEQGDADAQFYLGVLFEEGDGVPQDLEEAARFFSLAAEQGHINAQWGLKRINMILGRYTVSAEPMPDEDEFEFNVRRMIESTKFQVQKPPKRNL